jgi:hypothetical protein
MSSDLLSTREEIISRNRGLPLPYNAIFPLLSSRIRIAGIESKVATIYQNKTLNDFKVNFMGNQQNEIYNRKAVTTTYNFVAASFENEYQETTYLSNSAQLEMDVKNIKDLTILADQCLMIGDLAIPSAINTEQTTTDFGNRGILNANGSVELPTKVINTANILIQTLCEMAEELAGTQQAQASDVFFIIPYTLRCLFQEINDGNGTLTRNVINDALDFYGGYRIAGKEAYVNIGVDDLKIIAFIPNYLDVDMTVLPQIFKTENDDYNSLFKTRYISGTVGVNIAYQDSVVIQPFTQS